jgi:hypothetical protein
MKREKDSKLNYRLKLDIGQKVTFPKMPGDLMRERPAIVEKEYPTYYVAMTKSGYRETIPRYGDCGVRV